MTDILSDDCFRLAPDAMLVARASCSRATPDDHSRHLGKQATGTKLARIGRAVWSSVLRRPGGAFGVRRERPFSAGERAFSGVHWLLAFRRHRTFGGGPETLGGSCPASKGVRGSPGGCLRSMLSRVVPFEGRRDAGDAGLSLTNPGSRRTMRGDGRSRARRVILECQTTPSTDCYTLASEVGPHVTGSQSGEG